MDQIEAFRRRRDERYRMRYHLPKALGGSANVSKCGLRGRPDGIGGTAAIEIRRADASGAYVAGVLSCASPWFCPVCTPKIMTRRGQLIDKIAEATDAQGGTSLFVSLTGRHFAWDDPADLVGVMTAAIGSLLSGREWAGDSPAEIGRKNERDRLIAAGEKKWNRTKPPAPIQIGKASELGYIGQVRVIEVTDGTNGLHPHVHAALVFDRELTETEVLMFEYWLRRRWAKHLYEVTGRRVNPERACDVRRWTTDQDQEQRLGWYVTKIAHGWSLGRELAAADSKEAKGRSKNVAQMVAEYVNGRCTNHKLGARLKKIHAATLGRKAFYVSPDLLRWCGLDCQDLEDEEIANQDQDGHTIAEISQTVWSQVMRQHAGPDLLTGAETDGLPGLLEAFADLGIPVSAMDQGVGEPPRITLDWARRRSINVPSLPRQSRRKVPAKRKEQS